MFAKKGMTLIESLFAFSIYVTLLVMFISLMNQGLSIKNRYVHTNLSDEEVVVSSYSSLKDIVSQALP